jgi:hypothetical protein
VQNFPTSDRAIQWASGTASSTRCRPGCRLHQGGNRCPQLRDLPPEIGVLAFQLVDAGAEFVHQSGFGRGGHGETRSAHSGPIEGVQITSPAPLPAVAPAALAFRDRPRPPERLERIMGGRACHLQVVLHRRQCARVHVHHQIVDVSVLIEAIVLSPASPRWFADVTERLVSALGLALPIVISDMQKGPGESI